MLFAISVILAVFGGVGIVISFCMYTMTINKIQQHIIGSTDNVKTKAKPVNARATSHQKAMKKWRHTDDKKG